MKIKAKLTISRDSNDVMRIAITDSAAASKIVLLEISPHDFTMALTGLARVECDAELGPIDRLGKVKDSEDRRVVCPLDSVNCRAVLAKWIIDNCQEAGWEIDAYLGTQKSVGYRAEGGCYLNYRVVRWELPE